MVLFQTIDPFVTVPDLYIISPSSVLLVFPFLFGGFRYIHSSYAKSYFSWIESLFRT